MCFPEKHAIFSADVPWPPCFNSSPSHLPLVLTSFPMIYIYFLLFCLDPCQTLGSNFPVAPNSWVKWRKSNWVERLALIMWERKWLPCLHGDESREVMFCIDNLNFEQTQQRFSRLAYWEFVGFFFSPILLVLVSLWNDISTRQKLQNTR